MHLKCGISTDLVSSFSFTKRSTWFFHQAISQSVSCSHGVVQCLPTNSVNVSIISHSVCILSKSGDGRFRCSHPLVAPRAVCLIVSVATSRLRSTQSLRRFVRWRHRCIPLLVAPAPLHRPSASYQFPTTPLFHIALLTILLMNSSTAPFLSKLSDFLLLQPCGLAAPWCHRTDGWASPLHFHAHAAYRSATRFRAEVQREEDWVVPNRERRRAGCQSNLQVQRISVQFSQEAQCCSITSPSWLSLPPAPLLSKRKIQHVGLADAHGSHFHSHPNDGSSG